MTKSQMEFEKAANKKKKVTIALYLFGSLQLLLTAA